MHATHTQHTIQDEMKKNNHHTHNDDDDNDDEGFDNYMVNMIMATVNGHGQFGI